VSAVPFSASLFAEQYRIASVTYDRTGRTTEVALKRAVVIDPAAVYASKDEFKAKIADLERQFNNLRVLESVRVTPTFSAPDPAGLVLVDLRVVTVDTGNFIMVPYPEYNSNTGLTLKLKMRDYNFLGSMQVFSGDISYNFNKATGTQSLGTGVDFSIPFKLGKFNSSWENYYGVSYEFGKSTAQYNLSSGVSVAVATLPEAGILSWSPSVSLSYDWDSVPFSGNPDERITHDALVGKTFSFGHALSTGHIDWTGNYRTGSMASVAQNFDYHTDQNKMDQVFNAQVSLYTALAWCGPSVRLFWFKNLDGTTKIGNRIRGIKDDFIVTDSAFLLNFDVPIKIFTTDWTSAGFPEIFRKVDFECQIDPFIDAAVGNNLEAKTNYNLKDGWYALGFEIIGYPTKMRSIQGRISAGFDLVQIAEKIGGKDWASRVWNTDWRTNPLYEIDIGIGLFY
jgi:hypothetical protein